MRVSFLFLVCACVVVSCLLLGGGARAGYLSDILIQLLAIPLLLVSLSRVVYLLGSSQARWSLAFCLALVLVPLFQLIPLSPSVWTALQNREPEAATFSLLAREAPWMPLSVSPRATWLSAVALLPPIAIFVGTLQLSYRERRLLSLIILGTGLVSVVLGFIQVTQSPLSSLRWFGQHTEAVGFFVNRNHFAALLYSLTLFAAAWAVSTATTSETTAGRKRNETAWVAAVAASFTVIVMLVAAQAMARSRAGLVITMVALLGALALASSNRRNVTALTAGKLLLGATSLAMIFIAQFALYRILERFSTDPLGDARLSFARITIDAAKAFMPFGSGMGTFVPVYAMFERPEDAFLNAYVNRAHNDLLEVWLEAGAVGLGLVALFLIWLVLRSWHVWRHSLPGARDIDQYLARAATIVVGLLIAHSFVDYPLRTGAMMAVFAFACALLIEPHAGPEGETSIEPVRSAPDSTGFRSPQAAGTHGLAAEEALEPAAAPAARRPAERWGVDMEWPSEWQKGTNQQSASARKRPGPGSASDDSGKA